MAQEAVLADGFGIRACSGRFSRRNLAPRALLCRGIFLFSNSKMGPPAVWNVFGRDLRFVAQNGLISVFQ